MSTDSGGGGSGGYGSFRTILAGPGHSLPEALVNVRQVPGVLGTPADLGQRVELAPGDGTIDSARHGASRRKSGVELRGA